LNLNLLIEGVEKLDKGDGTGKLTVTGTIDAAKLRDKIVTKTKKKVEVISPVLKNNDKENKKSDTKNNKPDEKKPKEVVIVMLMLFISSVLLFTFFTFFLIYNLDIDLFFFN
jgi:hypothetical protein